MYGMAEREMAGDGACQFRSVADQLFGDECYHTVRHLSNTPTAWQVTLV